MRPRSLVFVGLRLGMPSPLIRPLRKCLPPAFLSACGQAAPLERVRSFSPDDLSDLFFFVANCRKRRTFSVVVVLSHAFTSLFSLGFGKTSPLFLIDGSDGLEFPACTKVRFFSLPPIASLFLIRFVYSHSFAEKYPLFFPDSFSPPPERPAFPFATFFRKPFRMPRA